MLYDFVVHRADVLIFVACLIDIIASRTLNHMRAFIQLLFPSSHIRCKHTHNFEWKPVVRMTLMLLTDDNNIRTFYDSHKQVYIQKLLCAFVLYPQPARMETGMKELSHIWHTQK